MRKTRALVLATVLLAVLSGCAGGGLTTSAAGCTAPYTPGGVSDLVSASGAAGTAPSISFPTPLVSRGSQVSVLRAGTGAVLGPRDIADFEYTIESGADGATLDASQYTGQTLRATVGSTTAGQKTVGEALECARVGSRIALTTTIGTLSGAGAGASAGLSDDASVVVVFDVVRGYLGRADGAPQPGVNGLPAVVNAPATGEPGISVPDQNPPKTLTIATLKAGSGERVKRGDTVVVNWTGLAWGVKSTFESTWSDGVPVNAVATAGEAAQTSGLPDGWVKAVTGARVGSEVMVVIPPGKDGYASDSAPPGVDAKSSVVIVFDVLGVVH